MVGGMGLRLRVTQASDLSLHEIDGKAVEGVGERIEIVDPDISIRDRGRRHVKPRKRGKPAGYTRAQGIGGLCAQREAGALHGRGHTNATRVTIMRSRRRLHLC